MQRRVVKGRPEVKDALADLEKLGQRSGPSLVLFILRRRCAPRATYYATNDKPEL